MLRAWALVLLAGVLPSAAALDASGLPDAALEGLVLDEDPVPSLGGTVRGLLGSPAPASSAPVPSAGGSLGASSAGPASTLPEAVEAARSVLLAALAVGGGVVGAALGWRHLHRRNVLEHPARTAILALLRRSPGLHLRAIARATALPVQHAAYHLDTLEKLGLVGSQTIAGKRCYHEAGAGADVRRALQQAALAPGPAARQVLDCVMAHPGASQSEVARELGMLPGSARWHLRRLAQQGSLEEARRGRALTYRPKPAPPERPR